MRKKANIMLPAPRVSSPKRRHFQGSQPSLVPSRIWGRYQCSILQATTLGAGMEKVKVVPTAGMMHQVIPITPYCFTSVYVHIPAGIIALAGVIPDMEAMTSLHVGKNNIPEKEMRKITTIAMRKNSMKILCEVPFKDKTLTELDVSGKNLGTEGALVVAGYLDGNGALTNFTFSGDDNSKSVTMETTMTVADFSGKGLGVSGAIMLSAFLPKCT
jgi:hypothetical protein